MRFGLAHLDPVIAKALEERLCRPRESFIADDISWGRSSFLSGSMSEIVRKKRRPNSEEKYSMVLRRRRDDAVNHRTLMGLIPTVVIGAGAGVGLWYYAPPALNQRLLVSVGIGAALTILGYIITRVRALEVCQKRILSFEIILEELVSVQPYLALSPLETAYFDFIVKLSVQESNLEARRIIRRTFPELNELMVAGRAIEQCKTDLLSPKGARGKTSKRPRFDYDDDDEDEPRKAPEVPEVEIAAVPAELEPAVDLLCTQEQKMLTAMNKVTNAFGRIRVYPGPQIDAAVSEISTTVEQMKQSAAQTLDAVSKLTGGGARKR